MPAAVELKVTKDNGSESSIKIKNIGASIKPDKTEDLLDKWAAIPPRPSISETDAKIISMLDERYGVAKDRHMRRIDVFNSSYLQYRSVSYFNRLFGLYPSYWSEWGTNVFIPKTFEVVEGARAQLKAQDPDFVVEPLPGFGVTMSMSDVIQSAKKANTLIKGEWDRSHSAEEALEALDDAIIWGTGILRNDLIKEKDNVQELQFDAEGRITYVSKDRTTYFGVGTRRVHPYDFMPEPSPDATVVNGRPGKRQSGLRYCFVRSVVDVEDLRHQYAGLFERKAYGVTDSYKYLVPSGDVTDYKYMLNFVDDLYPAESNMRYPSNLSDMFNKKPTSAYTPQNAYYEGKIEVLEYFERDRYIVLAGGLILRDSPNPYPHKVLPFSAVRLFNTKTFWSIGYPELMKHLQLLDNVMYEQGLNNIVMSVHKMFAVNERMLEDPNDLVVRPFGIVRMKSIQGASVNDAIQPINFSPITNDFFNFLQKNKENIQTLTGQSEFTSGGVTQSSKVERATVANRIAQGSSLRGGQIIQAWESMIEDSVEQLLKIAQFYYQKGFDTSSVLDVVKKQGKMNKFVRVYKDKAEREKAEDVGDVGGKSSPFAEIFSIDEIQGNFGVKVTAGTSSSYTPEEKSALKAQAAEWMSTILDPVTKQPKYDVTKFSDEIMQEVFKIADPSEYYFEPDMLDELPPESAGLTETLPKLMGGGREQSIPEGGGAMPPNTP